MMTADEAQELVLREALVEDGILVRIRMGDDPGQERMDRVLIALRCLFDSRRGETTIERRLAYALHCLAIYVEENATSWSRQGSHWRPRFVEQEVPQLVCGVESIFADDWAEAML